MKQAVESSNKPQLSLRIHNQWKCFWLGQGHRGSVKALALPKPLAERSNKVSSQNATEGKLLWWRLLLPLVSRIQILLLQNRG